MSCKNTCSSNCIKNNITKCPSCTQFNPNTCETCVGSKCPSCNDLNLEQCFGSCMPTQFSNCPSCSAISFKPTTCAHCLESKCPSCNITKCDKCLDKNVTKCPSCYLEIDECKNCLSSKCPDVDDTCAICDLVDFPCESIHTKDVCAPLGLGCCEWQGKSQPPKDLISMYDNIIIGSVLSLVLLGLIIYYFIKKRKRK